MAFQTYTSIQTQVCPVCQGTGCSDCGGFGVYAVSQDKSIIFSLPPFLDLEKRKQAKLVFLIKRTALVVFSLILIISVWILINAV